MPRRALSILPCPVYAPDDPTPLGARGCERCGHRVHDLSAMDAPQVRRLLDEPRSRLCVHARVRSDGALVSRRARLPLGLTLGLAAVAACTPHVRDMELELPGSLCEDADGFEVPCESEIDAWLETIPEPSPTPEVLGEGSEPPAVRQPEGDDGATPIDSGEYDILGFVDPVDDWEASEAEQQEEREWRLDLERRAKAAAVEEALTELEHAG